MSESDQDAIIGRTAREYRDAKKELAALHAEAESLGTYLLVIAHALQTKHSFAHSFTVRGAPIDLSDFPTAQRLMELSNRVDAVTANKERLTQLLKDAGFPPPTD